MNPQSVVAALAASLFFGLMALILVMRAAYDIGGLNARVSQLEHDLYLVQVENELAHERSALDPPQEPR